MEESGIVGLGDRAGLSIGLKYYLELVEQYKEKLQKDPKNVTFWLGLANTWEALKKDDNALGAYQQVLDISGNNVTAQQGITRIQKRRQLQLRIYWSFVTEDELKSLVDAGQEEGVFELVERKMIYSIFELGETLAREIMVPRIDMLALDVITPMQDAVDAFLESGYSRAPVFEETVDNTLGLLYAKDLLRAWREGGEKDSLKEQKILQWLKPTKHLKPTHPNTSH